MIGNWRLQLCARWTSVKCLRAMLPLSPVASGGEQPSRRCLPRSPDIYLLDEPTNHLDPQHQLDVLEVFVRKARAGAIVIASLHDVNLAARFADQCLLLFGDGRWALGVPDQILTEERLTELYATRMESVCWRDSKLFVAAGQPSVQ